MCADERAVGTTGDLRRLTQHVAGIVEPLGLPVGAKREPLGLSNHDPRDRGAVEHVREREGGRRAVVRDPDPAVVGADRHFSVAESRGRDLAGGEHVQRCLRRAHRAGRHRGSCGEREERRRGQRAARVGDDRCDRRAAIGRIPLGRAGVRQAGVDRNDIAVLRAHEPRVPIMRRRGNPCVRQHLDHCQRRLPLSVEQLNASVVAADQPAYWPRGDEADRVAIQRIAGLGQPHRVVVERLCRIRSDDHPAVCAARRIDDRGAIEREPPRDRVRLAVASADHLHQSGTARHQPVRRVDIDHCLRADGVVDVRRLRRALRTSGGKHTESEKGSEAVHGCSW